MEAKAKTGLVDYELVKWHLLASAGYLLIVLLGGLTYALQFIHLYPFAEIEFLSPGRVRMVHTQAAAYGLIATGFFGVVYYMVPKLTGFPVLSKKGSWVLFFLYNAAVVAAVVLILLGYGQGLEWAETPAVLDPAIALVVTAIVVNLLTPVFRARKKTHYVSIWYIVAALVWTPLVYVMGNFLPEYFFMGTGGAAISSMYIHDLVGLFVTPIGIAMVYYLLPVALNKPLYSHALSLIGFWGLAIFYPLNSVHHYLYSPIPMWAQYASIVASVGMHVVVYTVVFNILATMAGAWDRVFKSIPLLFILMGALMYLGTCIQCAIHVTLSVQKIIHFTDWVPGHAHMIMFGTFASWIFAWFYYLYPRMVQTPLFSNSLALWHFWLSLFGITIMAVDLGILGLIQGSMWKNLVPFIDTVEVSIPYWWIRLFSGVAIFVGVLCFFVNIYMTWKESKLRSTASVEKGTAPQPA